MSARAVCCLLKCTRKGEEPLLKILVWPPSDSRALDLRIHAACFREAKDATVSPDPIAGTGGIPRKARCVFCGGLLPVVGRHPYALEVGGSDHLGRYWAHADCTQSAISGAAGSVGGQARGPGS